MNINKKINNLKNLEELIIDGNKLSKISKKLCLKLGRLKTLSIRGCFPYSYSESKCASLFSDETVNYLSNLEILDLSNNCLIPFPKNILIMKKLKILILEATRIGSNMIETAFKDSSRPFPVLKELVLSFNNMKKFPPVILKIKSLEELAMQRCGLGKIPDSIESLAMLTNLTSIDLSFNKLRRFPTKIGRLEKLEHLDLSYNSRMISPIRPNIGRLQKLKTLRMSNCNVGQILLKRICELTNLRVLDLSENIGLRLPKEIGKLVDLRELDLMKISKNESDNCNFELLPQEIAKLSKLEKLNISGNGLNAFPSVICELTSLKSLFMVQVGIDKLPDQFSNLRNLRKLIIEENEFKEFPLPICKLESLEVLNVSNNFIVNLPCEIKSLTNLKVLDISQNLMKKISENIWGLISLEELKIDDDLAYERVQKMRQMVLKAPPDIFKRRGLKINQMGLPYICLFPIHTLN